MTVDPALLFAAERAVDSGAALLRRGRRSVGTVIAKGDRDFATEVDLRIEETIRATLEEAAPGIAFLGEEEGERDGRLEAMWVLDPIDGTVNFANGSPLCAISLALVERGEPTLGLIDLPLIGERYLATRGGGASLNGRTITVLEPAGLHEAMVGFADFAVGPRAKVENPIHRELMGRLVPRCLRVRVHGSECLDLAWLAAGRLDVSVMLSSLPWDVTAGVLIAREAGAEAFDHGGSPWTPQAEFTICCTPGLVDELLPTGSGGGRSGGGFATCLQLIERQRIHPDLLGKPRHLAHVARPEPVTGDVERSRRGPQLDRDLDRRSRPDRYADSGEHRIPGAVLVDRCEMRAVDHERALSSEEQSRLRRAGDEHVRRTLGEKTAGGLDR